MPRKGSKTITISDEKHREAQKTAKKLGLTLKEYIESLIGYTPSNFSLIHIDLEVPSIEGT